MHVVFEHQLALFEALRRLGFTSDELFTGYNKGNPVTVILAEGKQFVVSVEGGLCCDLDENEYFLGWREAAEWWNDEATRAEQLTIYRAHVNEDKLAALILALAAKGMPLRDRDARRVAEAARLN